MKQQALALVQQKSLDPDQGQARKLLRQVYQP
jgi:hypothetical protein